jgi:DNA-binding FrmR family transcriptional regulator
MHTSSEESLVRLDHIEALLRDVRGLVEEGAYCPDVLARTRAARLMLAQLDAALLRDHIGRRVPEGIREGRDEQVLRELAQLFDLSRR